MLQDMELIEVLWKQDVDMGFTVEALQAQSQQAQQGAAESATLTKPAPDPDPKANSSLSDLLVEPLDKVNTLDHGLGRVGYTLHKWVLRKTLIVFGRFGMNKEVIILLLTYLETDSEI